MNLENNVYIGKGVQDEVKRFLQKYGISSRLREKFYFIELLALIRFCDMFSREYASDYDSFTAEEFAVLGDYSDPTVHPDDANREIFNQAGIRALVNYFLDKAIDKRDEHVNPNRVNWAAPNGATRKMIEYAACDTASSFDIVTACAELVDAEPRDFVQSADKSRHYFVHSTLQERLARLDQNRITPEDRAIQLKIRERHFAKMSEETRRAYAKHLLKKDRCDAYRKKNNMEIVYTPNPFPTRVSLDIPSDILPSAAAPSVSLPVPEQLLEVPAADQPVSSTKPTPQKPFSGLPSTSAAAAAASATETQSGDDAANPDVGRAEEPLTMEVEEVAAATSGAAAAAAAAKSVAAGAAAPPKSRVIVRKSASTTQVPRPSPSSKRPQPPTTSPIRPPKRTSASDTNVSLSATQTRKWAQEAASFRGLDRTPLVQRFDRIIEIGEGGTVLVDHILAIVRDIIQQNNFKHYAILPIILDHLPFQDRRKFVLPLISESLIYPSLLRSLHYLNFDGFGGIPLIDAVVHPELSGTANLANVDAYVKYLSSSQIEDFFVFAASVSLKGRSEIRDQFSAFSCFSKDYLKNVDFGVFSKESILPIIIRICEQRQIPIPEGFKIIALEQHLAVLVGELTNANIHTTDFDSLVREAVSRLGVGMQSIVRFLIDKVKVYPSLLASEFGFTPPPVSEIANLIDFKDPACNTRQHRLTAPTMQNIGQVFISDYLTLEILRSELLTSKFISLMHHEPPKTLPLAAKCDLISIRTRNQVFHILPITYPAASRDAIGVLRSFEGTVYVRSPQGLYKILLEAYGWSASFFDITPYLENHVYHNLQEDRLTTFSDVSHILFNCAPCWSGKVFSAHKCPSRRAIQHREIAVSLVYVLGQQRIKAHDQSAGADTRRAGDEEEERRRQEEERHRQEEEELRRQEEEDRLQQEEEERIRLKAERLREETRRLDEERERARRRREDLERERQRSSLRRHRDRSPNRRPSDSTERRRSPDHGRRSDAYEPAEDVTDSRRRR